MFSGNATEYGINENPVDYVVRCHTILLSGPRFPTARFPTAAEPEVQSLLICVSA